MIVSTTEGKKCHVIQVMNDKEFMSTNYTILMLYIMAEAAVGDVVDLTS